MVAEPAGTARYREGNNDPVAYLEFFDQTSNFNNITHKFMAQDKIFYLWKHAIVDM
jgi:hypothetical protein